MIIKDNMTIHTKEDPHVSGSGNCEFCKEKDYTIMLLNETILLLKENITLYKEKLIDAKSKSSSKDSSNVV